MLGRPELYSNIILIFFCMYSMSSMSPRSQFSQNLNFARTQILQPALEKTDFLGPYAGFLSRIIKYIYIFNVFDKSTALFSIDLQRGKLTIKRV